MPSHGHILGVRHATRARPLYCAPLFARPVIMQRFIEYATNHPLLLGAALLAFIIVLTNESRMRKSAFAAISAQDLVRLMNQGALVLDIRKPDEFAQGHVNGAKQ